MNNHELLVKKYKRNSILVKIIWFIIFAITLPVSAILLNKAINSDSDNWLAMYIPAWILAVVWIVALAIFIAALISVRAKQAIFDKHKILVYFGGIKSRLIVDGKELDTHGLAWYSITMQAKVDGKEYYVCATPGNFKLTIDGERRTWIN